MSQRPDTEHIAAPAGATRLQAVLSAAPPAALGAPLMAAPPSKCLVAPAERVKDGVDIGAALREAFAYVHTGEPPEEMSATENAWVSGVNKRNVSQDQLVDAVILLANMIKTIDTKITTVVTRNFGVVAAQVTENNADLATLKQKVEADVADLNAQISTLRSQFTERPWTSLTEDLGMRISTIEAKIGEALKFEEAAESSNRDLGSSIAKLNTELSGLKELIGQNNVSSELTALKERLDALPSPTDLSKILKAVEQQPNLDDMNKAVKSAQQVAKQSEKSLIMPPNEAIPEAVKVTRQPSNQKPARASDDDDQPGTQGMPKSVEDLYSAMMKQSVEFL